MFDWNEERERELVQRWARGESSGYIAGVFGITRNAVSGKIDRMNLAPRRTTAALAYNNTRRAGMAKRAKSRTLRYGKGPEMSPMRRLLAQSFILEPEVPIPEAERQRLLVSTEDGRLVANEAFTDAICRWPIGDPQQPDFHFCNKSKVAGLSYCEGHARRAYLPPQVRVVVTPTHRLKRYNTNGMRTLEKEDA